MEALKYAIPMLAALVVSAAATLPVARLARAFKVYDRPTERSVSHRTEIPLLGGLAIGLGFVVGLAVALRFLEPAGAEGHVEGLLIGGLIILVLGVVDDRIGLGAGVTFSVQILAAAIALHYGYQIDHLTDPVTQNRVTFEPWFVWVASTLWIVGITNAVNLVDGLDGLATGVGTIIGATLTLIAFQAGQTLGICVGLALVGALVGFLPFNFAPARIFLGDTGALFIGFVLSLLALEGYRRVSLLTFVVPLLALAVPILDTVLSIIRRVRLRTNPFRADRKHMHHRLLETRGSPRAAVLQFYFLTVCFCLIAVSFTNITGYPAALFLVAVVVLTLRLLWNLGALSFTGKQRGVDELPAGAKEEKQ